MFEAELARLRKTMDPALDVPQRGKRSGAFRLVHAGLVVCGLAAGLQEFVALQRWRLKQWHQRTARAAHH